MVGKGTTYLIVAEWKNGDREIIDEADSREEAQEFMSNYALAFKIGHPQSECIGIYYTQKE